MFKSFLFLSALSASALATFGVTVINDNGSGYTLYAQDHQRLCYCLKNTQSASIRGFNGGTIKLFSTADCTGKFATLGSNDEVGSAKWVNSVSFGRSDIPSRDPPGCPDYHNAH
ncbi:MAG: hypothetical protein BYD32DRAFT_463787 [Podila humilis]|nr:MAG: hypothetical protein BYD32DRAFT_463787 [Podila humilis]